MRQRIGVAVCSMALIGAWAAAPAVGAAEHGGQAMGGDKIITLSLTKDYTASPWTHEMGYSNRAMSKLGFGVKNVLLGWTELFTEPKEASQNGDNVLMGIGKGLKNGLEQELGGVVHVVTFPITNLDAPLPEGGTQLLSGK